MNREHWREEPLGSLCTLINGRAFRPNERSPSGLPIVRIQNLNDPSKPFNFYSGDLEEKYQIDNGTPLIAWSGTPGTSFGAHLWDRGRAALNQHIFRVDVNESRCDKKFLVHAVNFKLREWIANENVKGSVGLRHINKGELQQLRIPLPFPDEPKRSIEFQRLIVNRLDAQLRNVKAARNLLATMRQDAGRLLTASVANVQRQLDPTSPEVPLGLVANVIKGRASGEGTSAIRVFKTKHVYPHRLKMDRPSHLKQEQVQRIKSDDPSWLRSGDVLMANIAEGTLGRVTYVEHSSENWTVDTQIFIIRPKDQREVLAKWIYYYLWSDHGQRQIKAQAKGLVFGKNRGQTHIYARNVEQIPLLLPAPDHQRLAVQHLDRICEETERLSSHLEEDAKMIMQAEAAIIARAFSPRGVSS